MQSVRRALSVLILIVSFAVLTLPVFAQQVIATIPVGATPVFVAVNSVTNKIYVANFSCSGFPCPNGTVTLIDGATDNTTTVIAGIEPNAIAVNSATNKIYVTNYCGNDSNCFSPGTVTVIDGVTLSTATVEVGDLPDAIDLDPVTNQIYVANSLSADSSVTVIDGMSLSTTRVSVGSDPVAVAVNPTTNKIYTVNGIGGSVTVIDGTTLSTTTVPVGASPDALALNTTTNKIYVSNGGDGTVTVIDGATLSTTPVAVGVSPGPLAVDTATNKVYVTNNSSGSVTVIDGATLSTTTVRVGNKPSAVGVDPVTNKIYVANQCGSDPNCQSSGTVSVIDGATLAITNLVVGNSPQSVAVNATTDRIYVANTADDTVSVIDGTPIPPTALQFVPLTQPCRAVDTRPEHGGAGPIQGGTHQDFAISGAGNCGVFASAAAYSMNVSVVPNGYLGYLTVWPAGQPQPLVSTLNSLDGRIKANAAIIPAGGGGDISVYATNTTNVIVDVNGYFAPVSGSTLAFYPLTPCRVADTRHDTYPPGLGPPFLNAGQERAFPILDAVTCNIPSSGVAAYSLNFSVVPHGSLFYMTVWPTGETRPTVSTLNDIPGQIIANAAIVVAGTGGDVSVYPTNDTDLIIDINGYFAAAGTGGLSLYGVQPCRVIDTRKVGPGNPFSGTLSPPVDVVDSPCGISSLAQAYVFNASVVPQGGLGYLTLWPDGATQPLVSTLNALDGSISSNMAIVPSTNGKVDAYASGITQLILDISSYFAP